MERKLPVLISPFASRFVPSLRQCHYVGGMPEAVGAFLARGLLEDARAVQESILLGCERDISKHHPRREAEYALAAWNSIPSHLGGKSKKCVFGQIADGAVIGGSPVFEEFVGALTEQYVCQQLIASCGLTPHYWSAAKSTGDIDLPVEGEGSVFALEVKAEENLRAFKGAHPEAARSASASRATGSRTGCATCPSTPSPARGFGRVTHGTARQKEVAPTIGTAAQSTVRRNHHCQAAASPLACGAHRKNEQLTIRSRRAE